MRGLIRKVSIVGVAAAAVVFGPMVRPAEAHAELEQSDPVADQVVDVAPESIRLRYNEPVEAASAVVEVLGPDGGRVDEGQVEGTDGDVALVAPFDGTAQGSYTASWRVVSRDAHQIAGSFVFHVGEQTGAPTPREHERTGMQFTAGVLRWLTFTGTILAVGIHMFSGFVMHDWRLRRRRLHRAVVLAAASAALGASALVLTQISLATGRSPLDALSLLTDAVADTRYARLGALRATLAVLLTATVALLRPRAGVLLALPLGLGLLLLPSLAGHAWTTSPVAAAVASDAVHQLAVAVWIGGLVALLLMSRGTDDMTQIGRRFSAVAFVAAAVVVITGTVSGWLQVRSLDALTGTGYGQLLLVKVAAVAVILGLGWLNRSQLLAAVERRSALLNSVRAEVAIAALVIAVTAMLVNREPARTELTRPFEKTVIDDRGKSVQLGVSPARVGQNRLHLYFYDDLGQPRPVDAAELFASVGSVPPRRIPMAPITPNHFVIPSASLAAPGTWKITVTSVHEGQSSTADFEVAVR